VRPGLAGRVVRAVAARIVQFWAAPLDGSAAAVFRVAFAILAAQTTVWVGMNVDRWYAEGGVAPSRIGNAAWSLWRFAPDAAWMGSLHVGLLGLGSALMLLGLWPRAGAFLLFAAHTSLQHRTPLILNSGDRLFAIVAFLAIFMPLGHRWSVASWWRSRRGKPAPAPASAWSTRLLQLQIAYIYAHTAMSKVMGGGWVEGTALRDVLGSPVFAEWPTWLDQGPLVLAMTWGTIAFELGFPFLVWFRRTRVWALAAGVAFHLAIDVLMIIPMFSWIMIVSYVAFLDDRDVERVLARWRRGRAGVVSSPP
jgi:hypothetical protein